jgi:hypothetical protein
VARHARRQAAVPLLISGPTRPRLAAALSGHRSESAPRVITRFPDDRPGYPPPLWRIVLLAADNLFRAARSAKMRAHDRA